MTATVGLMSLLPGQAPTGAFRSGLPVAKIPAAGDDMVKSKGPAIAVDAEVRENCRLYCGVQGFSTGLSAFFDIPCPLRSKSLAACQG